MHMRNTQPYHEFVLALRNDGKRNITILRIYDVITPAAPPRPKPLPPRPLHRKKKKMKGNKKENERKLVAIG